MTGGASSTPYKNVSSQATHRTSGGNTSDETLLQSQDMMEYCQNEIAHNTWVFNASDISHMLSPKQLEVKFQPEDVKCFEDAKKCCKFLVDDPFFEHALQTAVNSLPSPIPEWPTTDTEKEYYPPLATFLNKGIEHCNRALNDAQRYGKYEDVPEFAHRLYHKLQFVKYDRCMVDGTDDVKPSKLYFGGGRGLEEEEKSSWGIVEGHNVLQVEIPVVVGPSWSHLLPRAAVYGCCLFSASPTRSWSLVLGFNQNDMNLRFLIFHRGGCTASTDLNLTTEPGRKEAYRLILTMLLWTEDYHAGFCCFSTDKEYTIPNPQRNPTLKAQVQKILHHTPGICTRGTLISIVSKSDVAIEHTSASTLVPAAQMLRSSTRLANTRLVKDRLATSQPGARGKCKSDGEHGTTSRKKLPTGFSHPRTDASKPAETGPTCSIAPGGPPPQSIAHGIKVHGSKTGLSDEVLGQRYSCDTFLLKFCWPDDVQGFVEAEFLAATSGAFGTPSHIVSYTMREPSGLLVSNRIFLPGERESEYESLWWDVWNGHSAERPNYRDAACHLFGALGSTLLDTPSSWSLLESVSHALLGWLVYYQNGFMHRDVSIGNVIRLEPGLAMKTIDIVDPFPERDVSLKEPEQARNAIAGTRSQKESEQVRNAIASTRSHIDEIKRLVEKLGISSGCKGILIDGDMAANWKTYFDKDHDSHSLSGTEEFMSINLLKATLRGSDYLQSPVDDMHSFFWITLWAVMFNSHNESSRSENELWARGLWVELALHKTLMLPELQDLLPTGKLSPITRQLTPFLDQWFSRIEALQKDWNTTRGTDFQDRKEWFTTHFHLFAYRGIRESLELILQYREELEHKSFTTPP
ncbi:hypothetical protein E1B28_007761 [Marasmius oreades]|uniref:Fungal-type protein kinase domain-containing protein n=1 Tax=Marasmius oreades TaxID=181124 RepID=A0A9P7S277_9AGAR|nr:uncharacterized protein E1B28_007761 [Marasmius oreades]KAG7094149.1 hypothetical protein E1B28_007761 [Marasmius oreades]